ncbi:MAG: hypothetical protein FWD53_00620 [Phycisphaerales bacterium]|nr:hypothetical protein [Phycisphaerales bacterium]
MDDSELILTDPAMADLAARIRALGMNLNKAALRGEEYPQAFRRHLTTMAEMFDCRVRQESAGLFDDIAPPRDVVWVRDGNGGRAVVAFEIDATVKMRSFQKLQATTASHKIWIYFGRDVWGFRTFLQKHDPSRQIVPVIVPQTFVPSFDDENEPLQTP